MKFYENFKTTLTGNVDLRNQADIFKAMSRPDFYPHAVDKIEQRDTIISKRNLMRRGKLDRESIDALAGKLAGFYQRGAYAKQNNTFGSLQTIRANCEENFRQTEPFVGEIIDERKFQIIRAATRAFLIRRSALFDQRVEQQRIRDCHGDLRTGHIYFSDGIQIIDCIEFNDRFRYADVTSDLAFLAMDVDFEGHPVIARQLIEEYLNYTEDREIFVLLDFYKCYRAWVRAKVYCFRLQEKNDANYQAAGRIRKTRRYIDLAYRYTVQFTRPTIWVICGLPASGKSTIAGELAKILKVVVLRSDVVRKELFGLDPEEPQDEAFESGIYSNEVSRHTYAKLLLLAQEEVNKGRSLILDATYSSEYYRDGVICLAKDMDANIIFIECAAPYQTLKKRLMEREATASLSDARLQHLKQFRAQYEPLTEIRNELHVRIDTKLALNECIRQILAHDHFATSQQIGELIKIRLSEKA